MASQISPGSMMAISTTLPALGIIAVATRFYIRVAHRQGLKADDWLILPALFTLIGMGIAVIIGVEQNAVGYAVGTNDFNFVNWSIVFVEQIEFAIWIMSALNLGFVKLSIIFFYRRIFLTGSNRIFNWITKILVVLVILWTLAFFFVSLLLCGPTISYNWGSYEEALEHCGDPEAANYGFVGSEFALDVILFVIPIAPIWRLQISTARRLAILVIFALGALAVITSLIKVVIFALIYTGGANDFVGGDPLIIISLYLYWTMFGCGVGVLVACLPTLQVWFRKVTVDAISKNVRGIFSVVSLSRNSQRSGSKITDIAKDTNSSRSGRLDEVESMELGKLSEEHSSYRTDSHVHAN